MADFGQSATGDPLQNSQNRPSYHLGMISNLTVIRQIDYTIHSYLKGE